MPDFIKVFVQFDTYIYIYPHTSDYLLELLWRNSIVVHCGIHTGLPQLSSYFLTIIIIYCLTPCFYLAGGPQILMRKGIYCFIYTTVKLLF